MSSHRRSLVLVVLIQLTLSMVVNNGIASASSGHGTTLPAQARLGMIQEAAHTPGLPSSTFSRATALGSTAATDSSDPFTLVFDDEFSGNSLDMNKWVPYYGLEGGFTGTTFDGYTNCQEGNGELTLNVTANYLLGRPFRSCGVGTWNSLVQTYGKYEFRARIDSGYHWDGLGILWPKSSFWPPEVDACEYSAARDDCMFTLHYGMFNDRLMNHFKGDFTQWHTIAIEWTPDRLSWLLDGVVQCETTVGVPQEPMWFGLMTDAFWDASNLGAYHVKWVHIYSYNG